MFSREEIALEFVDAQELAISALRDSRFRRAAWVAVKNNQRSRRYDPVRRRQKYLRGRNKQLRNRAPVRCASPQCGAQFVPLESHRLYCSEPCRVRWYRRIHPPPALTAKQRKAKAESCRRYRLAHRRELSVKATERRRRRVARERAALVARAGVSK